MIQGPAPLTWVVLDSPANTHYSVSWISSDYLINSNSHTLRIYPRPTALPVGASTSKLTCSNCSSGYKSDPGAPACTECGLGHYSEPVSETCTVCPAGTRCPTSTTPAPVDCGVGFYQTLSTQSVCVVCPVGTYCGLARTVTPTDCPAGSYRGTEGGVALASCTTCPSGNFCPVKAVDPTNCTAGKYNPITGQGSEAACIFCPAGNYCPIATTTPTVCPLGSYRNIVGGASLLDCPACAAGSFCVSPTTVQQCPEHTTSVAGSPSLLNCRCLDGFQCAYTKQITATVTLNTSYSSFTSDLGGIQTLFKEQVAKAAGVSPSQVIIKNVAPKLLASGRRLLSVRAPSQLIDVHMVVRGAEGLRDLSRHLSVHSPFLYQGHVWGEAHRLSSQPRVGRYA